MTAGRRQTFELSEFHGGIDLRDGLFSSDPTRFRERRNVWTDKGRKIRRRMPCLAVGGALSVNCQGQVGVDGEIFTFAKKGDVVTHTGAMASLVTTLYFDNPDLCTTWTLLAADVFDGYAAALIRHTFPSTTYPSLVFLHVWDGLLYAPTYVQDPAFPGSFSPSITDLEGQEYSSTFRPALGQGASKLWSSTLRKNAQCCRTADARVWNQRSREDLLTNGEEWCFVVPEGAGVTREYLVASNAADLSIDGRWAYYVLERKNGTSWEPMEEVAIAPAVNYTWRPVSVASRFAGGWNEIKLQVRWGSSSAGLIRLRLVPGDTSVQVVQQPTVSMTPATGIQWNVNVTQAQYRHRDGDLQTEAAFVALADNNKTYLLGVAAGGKAELVDITSSFPTGWDREYRRFFKRIEFVAALVGGSTEANDDWATFTTLTGTVTTTAGSDAVNGVGTTFTTQLVVTDVIRVGGELQTVQNITTNILLDTVANWVGNNAGATIDKKVKHYAKFISGETYIKVNAAAIAGLQVGDTVTINAVAFTIIAISNDGIAQIRKNNGVGGSDAGDWTATVDGLWPISRALTARLTDYKYAFQLNENSEWYTGILLDYTDLAGAQDAVSINTAAHDNTGGEISAIIAVKNRMAICYPGSLQLWSIDQATNATAYLDQLAFGTGDQVLPSPVPFYGSIVIPSQTGFRSISVVGANTDNLQDLNIGEPIASLATMDVRTATFWPWYGQVIFAGVRSGVLVFQVLDYSRESKITAWSEWTVGDVADVDLGSFVVVGSKLYFRVGTTLRYFDAAATTFRDSGDVAGSAYESSVLWHFNDLDRPGLSKRYVGLDLVQQGRCKVYFQLAPYGSYGSETSGPSLYILDVEGSTYGKPRIPLSMTAPAAAPRLTSRDETGWVLERIAYDFMYLRR